ncbi:hypothetical protein SY83_20825 [Paenibacillus swuensis]|uniref:Serine aminopeptidase S33 domain-containing protein n=2 Tax=Paenibacillus swuensis TaxID=1178515 RepID=A0A172TQK0_9BACL|nr:hypothetical protein SY83_20825 [Paenibacillus swuensis]
MALTFAVILILVFYACWYVSARAQTPKRRPIEHMPDMPYEDISFLSQGSVIKGWFVPSSDLKTKPPVILIAHGWNSNRSRVLRYARPLYNAGYALLLYDARSHGESDGIPAPSGMAFRDDLLSAVDYIHARPDVDANRIGVLGHSLGGFAGAASLWDERRIRALVTDSMPVRIEAMIGAELNRLRIPLFPLATIIPRVWFIRAGINREMLAKLDLISALSRSGDAVPRLHVHSRNDDYVPSTELDYLAAQSLSGAEHLYVDARGHSCSETDPLFWERVLPFFRNHI